MLLTVQSDAEPCAALLLYVTALCWSVVCFANVDRCEVAAVCCDDVRFNALAGQGCGPKITKLYTSLLHMCVTCHMTNVRPHVLRYCVM